MVDFLDASDTAKFFASCDFTHPLRLLKSVDQNFHLACWDDQKSPRRCFRSTKSRVCQTCCGFAVNMRALIRLSAAIAMFTIWHHQLTRCGAGRIQLVNFFDWGLARASQQLAGGTNANCQHCADLGQQRILRALHPKLVCSQGVVWWVCAGAKHAHRFFSGIRVLCWLNPTIPNTISWWCSRAPGEPPSVEGFDFS